MKVLLVHNAYQQAGGEDAVFAAESRLLSAHGHTVLHYTVHNDAVRDMNHLSVGLRTIWSQRSYRDLRELIAAERPDVAHVHNTLPLVSPAVYYAAAAGVSPSFTRCTTTASHVRTASFSATTTAAQTASAIRYRGRAWSMRAIGTAGVPPPQWPRWCLHTGCSVRGAVG